MKIVDTLFGGTDDSAQRATKEQVRETNAFIKEQGELARRDALPLFGAGQQSRTLGAQAALDIFGQSIPQQASVFQQGNVGAQQTLLAGLPQVQNALLGLPTDFSALQPRQLQFDPSFAQQQVPQFPTAAGALRGAAAGRFGTALDQGLGGALAAIQAAQLNPELFPQQPAVAPPPQRNRVGGIRAGTGGVR